MSRTLPPEIEQLEQEIIRHAPVGVLACDSSGLVRVANPYACKLLGADKKSPQFDLAGRLISDLLPTLDTKTTQDAVTCSRWDQTVLARCVRVKTARELWTVIYLFEQDNRRERERLLEKEATTDELSGLPNRRAFQRTLEANLHRTLSLAIVDVDQFKQINDQLGHPVGDDVIELMGKTLKKCFAGESILVARMGGDEFSILFESATTESFVKKLNDFRTSVADLHGQHSVKTKVTVSIGAVISMQPGTGTRTLLTQADQQLYKAKAAGRNRVDWTVLEES